MLLIIGLGNPGPKYSLTRHNAGFRVVDHVSRAAKIPLYKTGYHAFFGKGRINGQEVILAKPMTFMNNSGLAAAALARQFRVATPQILVAYDDMDLPLGSLRLRPHGGSGGHNGMKSLIFHLQTEDFPRLRIGIGRSAEDVIDHVLEVFTIEEEAALQPVIETAVQAVHTFAGEGITVAMNRFNQALKK